MTQLITPSKGAAEAAKYYTTACLSVILKNRNHHFVDLF